MCCPLLEVKSVDRADLVQNACGSSSRSKTLHAASIGHHSNYAIMTKLSHVKEITKPGLHGLSALVATTLKLSTQTTRIQRRNLLHMPLLWHLHSSKRVFVRPSILLVRLKNKQTPVLLPLDLEQKKHQVTLRPKVLYEIERRTETNKHQ